MVKPRIVRLIELVLVLCCGVFAQRITAASPNAEKPNLIGTYLYTDRFEAAAKEQNRDLFDVFDEHFKKLAEMGVNCIHVTIPDGWRF